MKVFYDPAFLDKFKKVDVRIRKSVKEKILIFPLKREYQGYRSIDITEDYRALYKEVQQEDERIAYFVLLGTHDQLYR